MPDLIFGYEIVPSGGNRQDALMTGSLFIGSLEAAKRYVQTVAAPSVAMRPGLEVILRDMLGTEIWRGPYLGSASNA